MITWGVALCCHAAATSKSGIYAARFFLGVVSVRFRRECVFAVDIFLAG